MHRATPLMTSFRSYVAGGARSVISAVDDSKLMQEMAGNFMKGETRQRVESPQNYGFSSVVMDADKDSNGAITGSAEGFITFCGGNRSFPVCGVMDDRRHRLKDLAKGDTAMFRTLYDKLQFHLTGDGGFWTGPRDKTVRMQLLDEDSQQQQQQQPGTGQQQQQQGGGSSSKATGQQARYKDGQKSYRFSHLTKDESAMGGDNVRMYLSDGKPYCEANTDKNLYCGAGKANGSFALVVTVKGPTKNVMGLIG